jgi:hypothetical protein
VLPNASFTIIALVENKIAPVKVIRNPAIEILFLASSIISNH